MNDEIDSRYSRSTDITIENVREIRRDEDVPTVFEVDAINEDGQRRDNMTIIPRIRYENTKDLQFRHDEGVVGKYTFALCRENTHARDEMCTYLDEKERDLAADLTDIQDERHTVREIKQLLHGM